MNDAKLVWQERVSTSEFIASVWTSHVLVASARTILADPCISIAIIKDDHGARAVLKGPTTVPYSEWFPAGYICTTIRLRPGVVLCNFSAEKCTDRTLVLSNDGEINDWFSDTPLQLLSFDTAELFVEQLHKSGRISYQAPTGKAQSIRSYSRSVKRTTGFSPYRLQQLQRTHQALRLLKQGMSAAAVAAELDFVDESHLTRVVKQFLGHTPKQLLYLPQSP